TAAQPDLLPVTLTDAHTTDRRRLHLVELATPLLARLAPPPRRATGTPECTLGAATSTTTATGRTPEAATAGTAPASTTGTATRASATSARRAAEGVLLRHHRGVGPRHAGASLRTATPATGRRAGHP